MGEYDEEETEALDYIQLFEVNTKINRAFSKEDLSSSRTTVLSDFQAFLKYILEHNGMKLTAASSFIGRKQVFALNELMSNPEELKSTANLPDSQTILLFYNISKTLNVFVVSEKLWNDTHGEKFLASYSGGRPEWAQARRGDMALLFSRCEPGKIYLFREQLKQVGMELADTEDGLEGYWRKADFILSVFAERIMPALRPFGLIDFGYEKDRDEYFVWHGLGIEWFTITQLGKRIFKALIG